MTNKHDRINQKREPMTSTELDEKIADAMKELKADGVLSAIRQGWKDYESSIKDLIVTEETRDEDEESPHYGSWSRVPDDRKDELMEKYMDRNPCETYCYIMFKDNGDLRGFTIKHEQYWQGNSGPTSAISLSDSPSLKDIEREISNDLYEAFEIED